MTIPDHVKRQAMDAVSHRETTEFIRRFRPEDATMETLSQSLSKHSMPPRTGPIPAHVQREALDAIKHTETISQIRLMEDDGVIFAPRTPSREATQAAQRVIELQKKGLDVEKLNRELTRDDF